MSENRYSPHNGGQNGDAAQIYEYLSSMTPDELVGEMADLWDRMDDKAYDPQLIDTYLAALDEKDPVASDFNAETSLVIFREKHAQLFEQLEPASKSSDTAPRLRAHHYWGAVRTIAAVAAVMLGCMIFAQALGFDVFGAIAHWTEETFHFESSAPMENGGIDPDAGYTSLQEALDAYGIKESVAPRWYPSEFEMSKIQASFISNAVKFYAFFKSESRIIAVTIYQFKSAEDASKITFEKDTSSVILYKCGGITHYLMANNGQMEAVWTNANMMCSISGDLSEEELKCMIDSIYER
jgi:hypothetical protein